LYSLFSVASNLLARVLSCLVCLLLLLRHLGFLTSYTPLLRNLLLV
jgi:hypothetical protein